MAPGAPPRAAGSVKGVSAFLIASGCEAGAAAVHRRAVTIAGACVVPPAPIPDGLRVIVDGDRVVFPASSDAVAVPLAVHVLIVPAAGIMRHPDFIAALDRWVSHAVPCELHTAADVYESSSDDDSDYGGVPVLRLPSVHGSIPLGGSPPLKPVARRLPGSGGSGGSGSASDPAPGRA